MFLTRSLSRNSAGRCYCYLQQAGFNCYLQPSNQRELCQGHWTGSLWNMDLT